MAAANQINSLVEMAKAAVKRSNAREKKKPKKKPSGSATRDFRGVDGIVDDSDSSGPGITDYANRSLQERDNPK